jgi:hypothetical protein
MKKPIIPHIDSSIDVVLLEVIGIHDEGEYYCLSLKGDINHGGNYMLPKEKSRSFIEGLKATERKQTKNFVLAISKNNGFEVLYGPADQSKIYRP